MLFLVDFPYLAVFENRGQTQNHDDAAWTMHLYCNCCYDSSLTCLCNTYCTHYT